MIHLFCLAYDHRVPQDPAAAAMRAADVGKKIAFGEKWSLPGIFTGSVRTLENLVAIECQ